MEFCYSRPIYFNAFATNVKFVFFRVPHYPVPHYPVRNVEKVLKARSTFQKDALEKRQMVVVGKDRRGEVVWRRLAGIDGVRCIARTAGPTLTDVHHTSPLVLRSGTRPFSFTREEQMSNC